MKVNKRTVSLSFMEFLKLFDLDIDFSNASSYQFNNYKKSLEFLRDLKKQIERTAHERKI